MIDQHPELALVIVHDAQDVFLFAQHLIASCDYCHFSNLRIGHCQVRAQVVLELTHYFEVVRIALDVIDASEPP